MKKIIAGWICIFLSHFAVAADEHPRLVLDKVVFQISTKDWVSTQTALLTININATLNNADLVKARADIMGNLAKIVVADWHLTQFDRSQDNSGLEKLFVEAQARVKQTSLADIYKLAKDVSRPGATYSVTSVEFTPSLLDLEQAKTRLRSKLYQLANAEIAALNKEYPDQHYSLYRLYVLDRDAPLIKPKALYGRQMENMVSATAAAMPQANLSVSNELTLSAMVLAGSTRK